ncbi:MAG: LamG domain-containing protein, partial [Candidatus Nanohaloarchaeota archaeon QJJ-7]|nr:LamG domain-containing protein [Candidatus Nanohaloarchaeota archaeon QJJ-7]
GVTMDGSSDNDGWLYIGNSPNYEAADMIIDDFRIYNRSLSANKVEGIARNGIGLNVSTDLSPNEKDSLQVYYGDPFADHPEYNDSSMTSTSMDERPATSVGISRGKSEIVDKLRQQVEMMQELTGASIQIRESNGCNIIALESPRMDLRKEIC